MALESIIISLIGTIVSSVLAVIISHYINRKNEVMREKRALVADIFGYRFLINRKTEEETERFNAALNRVPILFDGDKDVISSYDMLLSASMITNPEERNKKLSDSLVTFLKALCRATGIKCENWNDGKFLNVFGS